MTLTPSERVREERIREESLHLKTDEELITMKASHAAKLPHVEEDLDKVLNYPDAVRWELKEAGYDDIEDELVQQIAYYQWKKARLEESVNLISAEQAFRRDGKVDRTQVQAELAALEAAEEKRIVAHRKARGLGGG